MPLNEDDLISHEQDGSFNEDYCKWCYENGTFVYDSKESLIDFLAKQMPNPENLSEEAMHNQIDLWLSKLKHWK